jgi:hypothetical protein
VENVGQSYHQVHVLVVVHKCHVWQLSHHELLDRTVEQGVHHAQQVQALYNCQKPWQVPVQQENPLVDRPQQKLQESL